MRAAWWWVDRWRKSTGYTDLSAEAQGVYRNLLDELWLRDGVLPTDEKILRKIGGDWEAWERVRDVVLARFYETAEGLRNATHDEVAARSALQAEKGAKRAADASREGGKFKAGTSRKPAEQPAKPPAENQPGEPAGDQPPSPSPFPTPPAREIASEGQVEPEDTADLDTVSDGLNRLHADAVAGLNATLVEAVDLMGGDGATWLAHPLVRPKNGTPITNPANVRPTSRGIELLLVTTDKIRGLIAAKRGDAFAAAEKRKGVAYSIFDMPAAQDVRDQSEQIGAEKRVA